MAEEKNIMDEELNQETAETAEAKSTENTETADSIAGNEAEASSEAKDDSEAVATENAEAEGTPSKEDKKASKKKSKTDKKQDALKEKVDELEDKVKRQMAEFENFRKRTDREKQAMFETGAKSVIEKILPVIDNFERGLAMVPEAEKEAPFVDGMNKIYKQMMAELEAIGVKPIEAVGAEFDPNFHNAVMQVENDELESGTVAQELLKGYTYRDTVVRHSMVAVVS